MFILNKTLIINILTNLKEIIIEFKSYFFNRLFYNNHTHVTHED